MIRTDLAALMEARRQAPGLLPGSDPAEPETGLARCSRMGTSADITTEESAVTKLEWFDPAESGVTGGAAPISCAAHGRCTPPRTRRPARLGGRH